MLYYRAGQLNVAVDLAFTTHQFSALADIVCDEDFGNNCDAALIRKCADFLVQNSQFTKAVEILAKGKQVKLTFLLICRSISSLLLLFQRPKHLENCPSIGYRPHTIDTGFQHRALKRNIKGNSLTQASNFSSRSVDSSHHISTSLTVLFQVFQPWCPNNWM